MLLLELPRGKSFHPPVQLRSVSLPIRGREVSIELVENEIRRFLSTEEPEVICISGHWGVGKTYAWNHYLKDSLAKGGIALKRYSYVSLFGINSLDELRYSIFENSVKSSDIGVELSLETLRSNTSAAVEGLVRKSLRVMQQTPLTSSYVGGLGPVWLSSVRGTIVCVDDIERRGKELSSRDVLGLVSTLKEQKKCKVVLILNDEALESDKEDFQRYYEKVVDTSLKFAPSPQECARIALAGNSKTEKLLADSCVNLGISNIRLIKRIERSVRSIEPILAEFDEEVLRDAVQSLALLGWVVFEPSRAPSLEYLLKRRGAHIFSADNKKEPMSEEEGAWNALLDVYGFANMEEIDLVLLEGVRNGFFDPSLVKKHASVVNEQIKAAKLDSSFKDAWGLYHNSFDNDQEEVLKALYQSSLNGVKFISPVNLSSTLSLLKALGGADQAAEVVKHYVASHGANRQLFDLQNYPFAEDVTDPDLVKAFKEKYAQSKGQKEPATILLSMAETSSWNPEDIEILSALPVDEYYQILKRNKGANLRKIINACLLFDRINNATPDMSEISKRAKDAMKRIGRESTINARRVKAYGIEVEPKNE
jgi:hypothetical protein